MRTSFLVALLLTSLISIAQPTRFQSMVSSYYEEYLKLNPTTASSIGDYRYNDQLENYISQPYRDQLKRLYSSYLDSLKAFDKQKLSARDQLSYQIFQYDLDRNLALLQYPFYLAPVNQFGDFRLSFSQLGAGSGNHPFKTVKDYDDFRKRINQFISITDTAIAYMRKGIAANRVQPRIVMEKVIPQIKAMLVDTISKSLFYNPIKNLPANFSAEDKQRLTTAYTTAIQQQIMPAYSRLLTFIQDEYVPHTRQTVGLSAIPNGKDEYAFLVQLYTTTNLTPDEVFAIGEKEVKRISSEMEKIKQQVGFKDNLKAFFNYVFTDKKFLPFEKDEDVVAAYNRIYEIMKPNLTKQFNMVPKTALYITPPQFTDS